MQYVIASWPNVVGNPKPQNEPGWQGWQASVAAALASYKVPQTQLSTRVVNGTFNVQYTGEQPTYVRTSCGWEAFTAFCAAIAAGGRVDLHTSSGLCLYWQPAGVGLYPGHGELGWHTTFNLMHYEQRALWYYPKGHIAAGVVHITGTLHVKPIGLPTKCAKAWGKYVIK